ncbi:hypothetical protein ACL1G5_10335 [Corynebacterium striatum]
MAISSYVVGPGSLTFTTPSGSFEAQITKAQVTPAVNAGDDMKVLSGEKLGGKRDYTATLDVTCLQDTSTTGLVAYSYNNAGKTVSFTYTPNTSAGVKIAGQCIVDPISVGGEVGSRATSDFSWSCPDLPKFTGKA